MDTDQRGDDSRRLYDAPFALHLYRTPDESGGAVRIPDMDLTGIGKVLVGGALVLLVVGGVLLLLGRLGVERLPGDLVFRRGNVAVFFPIGLMILLSVVGTIVLNILLRR